MKSESSRMWVHQCAVFARLQIEAAVVLHVCLCVTLYGFASIHFSGAYLCFQTKTQFLSFGCVRASVLLGKLCFAAKSTFSEVCHPPVILSTPSLCGAQPSKTSDRQSNGSGGLQQHNTLPLPSLCPVARFTALTVHTHTNEERTNSVTDFLFALWHFAEGKKSLKQTGQKDAMSRRENCMTGLSVAKKYTWPRHF